MLCVNPEHMCVDGTQTRITHKLLDPYKKQIQELVERGFQTTQILTKLQEILPGVTVKRTTLGDYCMKLRAELYEYTESPPESTEPLNADSILARHTDKIKQMLSDSKMITTIFTVIKADGYTGSYSLLQQYCLTRKPLVHKKKKSARKIKRKDLATLVWSGKTELSDKAISYIENNYPVFCEISTIITEFRKAYSQKDIDAVNVWCDKYSQCKFPAIGSFINGINADTDAFYNSMKYEYSNGLLEGSVNKLKAVKRSMFGRASYLLLRAKMLLANSV